MNNKNSLILVDPEFDPQASADCILMLKITTDSYSYAIVNKKINQLFVVFDHQECTDVMAHIAARYRTDPYLSLDFQHIKVSAYTPNSVFIPQDLYQTNALNSYKNYFKDEVKTAYPLPIESYDLQVVFAPEPFTEYQLNKIFPSYSKFDHAAPALLLSATLPGNALLLDFTVTTCNIVYKKDGQLIFSNYFETEDAGEFNYYLVLILKELAINPLSTSVYLSGIIHPEDEKYLLINKYFQDIRFLDYFKDKEFDILDNMPSHYYNSLLAIDLCGS